MSIMIRDVSGLLRRLGRDQGWIGLIVLIGLYSLYARPIFRSMRHAI